MGSEPIVEERRILGSHMIAVFGKENETKRS
jgi:hypothetical protein